MSFVKFNRFLLFILFISANTIPSLAQPKMPVVLPLKERAKVINRWLQVRLKTVLPELMRREGIDMWIVIAREYNEDPVIKTMLPANWMAARRRTILLMYDSGKEGDVERLAVARYDIGEFFKRAWDKEKQPDQWERLAEIIVDKNPKKIAINWSNTFALADGISHAEFESFTRAIPDKYKKRIVPG